MKTKNLFVSHITGNMPHELHFGSSDFRFDTEMEITSKFLLETLVEEIKKQRNCTWVTILFFQALEPDKG